MGAYPFRWIAFERMIYLEKRLLDDIFSILWTPHLTQYKGIELILIDKHERLKGPVHVSC
jgi:hypothetical protein